MSNYQVIEELCEICEKQSRIIREQSLALEALGTVILEDEKVSVSERLTSIIGKALE